MTTPPRLAAASALVASVLLAGCGSEPQAGGADAARPAAQADAPTPSSTFWNGATIYFMLTDRFHNGDPSNDLAQGRSQDGAVLRSYHGGDLAGVLQKMEEGYFDSLGVSAIWMTPFVEQILGDVDEGTGKTYSFHGYWTRDWTAVDPALGTMDDLRALVDAAHARGIRVIMDAVINHTGPVTDLDPPWPDTWVRTDPRCAYDSYAATVDCTLVDNLPDILTRSDQSVELPPHLLAKWEEEGRLEQELAELDAFFEETGYPRAPRFYVMKWLADWVRELGFDGYRVDTARNFDEAVAVELRGEADRAFADWKAANPGKVLDDLPFWFMGEVYHFDIKNGRDFDFGDRTVDYFAHGYDALINFGFKSDATGSMEEMFSLYSAILREGALAGYSVVNYADSHDDPSPYDVDRADPLGTGTKLLLAPGAAQIYYGDEVARPLRFEGARGDANLRSPMDWQALAENRTASGLPMQEILEHWRKLGRFRQAHPSVGAGEHTRHQSEPYVFSRTLEADGRTDRVLVAQGLEAGPKTIGLFGVFPDGTALVDAYSGQSATAADGAVTLDTPYDLVLMEEAR
jgi:alpha-amylase